MKYSVINHIKNFLLLMVFLTLSTTASSEEGHIGIDMSLSNETGNFGVYSLRERPEEITNIGAEFFFNEPEDRFFSLFGTMSRKGMGDKNLELGVKGKLYYVDQDKDGQTGQGLMMGVTARYWLPAEMPVSLAVDALYTPPIVAFADVKSALSFDAKVELRILPSIVGYIGFRSLTVDFDKRSNHELDKNVNIGVNIAIQ
jgi:hypothetical protein